MQSAEKARCNIHAIGMGIANGKGGGTGLKGISEKYEQDLQDEQDYKIPNPVNHVNPVHFIPSSNRFDHHSGCAVTFKSLRALNNRIVWSDTIDRIYRMN